MQLILECSTFKMFYKINFNMENVCNFSIYTMQLIL